MEAGSFCSDAGIPEPWQSPSRRASSVQEASSTEAADVATPPKSSRAAARGSLEVPEPEAEMWRRTRLLIDFQSRVQPQGYVIFAEAPGLRTNDLSLELSSDRRALT